MEEGEAMAAITALAVTGDVGAGKSTAARLFESFGGVRLDADAVVAELWRRSDVVGAAVGRWGATILDPEGRVVPARVAARFFSSRAEYDWGCALLHPPVKAELARRVAALDPDREWAVAEIPMLFESGVPDWVTATVFVTAPRDVRMKRCRARGWDEAELLRRESFFLPSEERAARSDFVLCNDGGLEDLERVVRSVWEAVMVRSGLRSQWRNGLGADYE